MCVGLAIIICCCCLSWYLLYVFFFKQKTAYELRISDWSSDVCSSDLRMLVLPVAGQSGGRCDPYLFLCSGVYRPAGGGRQVMEVTKRTRPEGFRIKPCRPPSGR